MGFLGIEIGQSFKFKSSKLHSVSKGNWKHVKKQKSDIFEDLGANNPHSIESF